MVRGWSRIPDPDEVRMTFGEHLEELRRTLLFCIAAIAVVFAVVYFGFRDPMMRLFLAPVENVATWDAAKRAARAAKHPDAPPDERPALEPRVQAIAPTEMFLSYLKVCALSSVVLASPGVGYLLWKFVAEGLYRHERRFVYVVMPVSILLFLSGITLCYCLMFPFALRFLLTFGSIDLIESRVSLSSYLSFFLMMHLLMGLVFQIPLVSVFLQKVGIVSRETLQKYRRHAILVMFIASAILTPQDPWTLLFAAIPMVLLYELGIWMGSLPMERILYSPSGRGDGR